ncbi:MAG: hypothetical protein LBG44_02270 [Gemmatimonadota bacterium]|nr:hypothetical protein [Gemmatimonadota bacterium]
MIALVFLLHGAEGLTGARPCPHHDLIVVASTGGHDAHGAESMGMGHHDHGQPSSDADAGSEHGCTCLGSCLTSPAGFLPAGLTASVAVRISPSRVVEPRADDPLIARYTPHFLPYAQGPPLG